MASSSAMAAPWALTSNQIWGLTKTDTEWLAALEAA
jgi:hypothetical protein